MHRVSILIPCYNSAAYLADTVQSAIDQTWGNKEIILVNDGSTDDTGAIADSFRSEMVKVYHLPNGGACKARNHAFEMSSGDYIQYLDADDLLPAEKIEQQMQLAAKSADNSVMSTSWKKFTVSPGDAPIVDSILYKDYEHPLNMLLDMWNTQEMMQTAVWLTPRPVIEKAGKWGEALMVNQDGEFFCRVLLAADSVRYCGQTHILYRTGVAGSVSNARPNRNKAASLLKSYQSYEREALKYNNSSEVKKALAMNYYSFIYLYHHLFPDLTQIALKTVNEWGIEPPDIGSKNFKRIAGILGFYRTLKLRKLLTGSLK